MPLLNEPVSGSIIVHMATTTANQRDMFSPSLYDLAFSIDNRCIIDDIHLYRQFCYEMYAQKLIADFLHGKTNLTESRVKQLHDAFIARAHAEEEIHRVMSGEE